NQREISAGSRRWRQTSSGWAARVSSAMTMARRLKPPMPAETPSALTHLEGSSSGETYDADQLIGLDPADARPLLARYDLDRAAATLTREALAARRAGGLWRWAELLPVRAPEHRIHLGEGATPLLRAPRLGAALGVPGLRIKADGLIDECGAVAREIAAETGAFDMSTLKEPYRVEGKKTMGLELAEDLGWA